MNPKTSLKRQLLLFQSPASSSARGAASTSAMDGHSELLQLPDPDEQADVQH